MASSDRTPIVPPRVVSATKAFHLMGEVSSDFPDWAYAKEEDADNYYGNWITGLGLFNVRFPKETTRQLTEEEETRFQTTRFRIGGLQHADLAYGQDWPLPNPRGDS